MSLFLGVDMGTSSLKAAVLDESGEVHARARREAVMESPRKDWYEVDGEKYWWQGFIFLCRELSRSISLASIEGVCVSSVCGSFVPVDEKGKAVSRAILYGIDRRAVEQIARLNERWKDRLDALGGQFTTHSIFPKILWLKEERPEVFVKTAFFLEPNNFVTYRLTGERAWDYPSAAGAGLVDRSLPGWPTDLFEAEGIPVAAFPPLQWPLSKLGTITSSASKITGLPKGIPVAAGACDINAEAAAARAFHPGDCVTVFGSTISMLLTTKVPVSLPGFISGMSLLENTYRIGAATSSGSRFLQWMNRTVAAEKPQETEQPTGILILPWLDGSRTPFHDPTAKMAFWGMDSSTSPELLLRAGRESLGYELGILFDMAAGAAPFPEVTDVSGGVCNDRELMELISSITGRILRIHPDVDASFGDALLAAAVAGVISEEEFKTAGNMGSVILPDLKINELYAPHREKFKKMAEELSFPRKPKNVSEKGN